MRRKPPAAAPAPDNAKDSASDSPAGMPSAREKSFPEPAGMCPRGAVASASSSPAAVSLTVPSPPTATTAVQSPRRAITRANTLASPGFSVMRRRYGLFSFCSIRSIFFHVLMPLPLPDTGLTTNPIKEVPPSGMVSKSA